MVKPRTGTLPTLVRFPGVARDLSPRVNFQCKLSYVRSYTPVCNRIHLHLCARERSRSPCQSSADYGNTKTPSMHRRLGSATLSKLALPGERNPNFPWEKSQCENTVVKGKSKCTKIKHQTQRKPDYSRSRGHRNTDTASVIITE